MMVAEGEGVTTETTKETWWSKITKGMKGMDGLFHGTKEDKADVPVEVKDKKPEEKVDSATVSASSPRQFIAYLTSKVSPPAADVSTPTTGGVTGTDAVDTASASSPRQFIAYLTSKVSPTAAGISSPTIGGVSDTVAVDTATVSASSPRQFIAYLSSKVSPTAAGISSPTTAGVTGTDAESIPSHSMHERFSGLATKLFSSNATEAEENENNRFDIRVFLKRLEKVAPAAVAAVVAASVALDAVTNKIPLPTIDLGRNKQEILRLNEELLVMQQTHHEKLNDSEMALLLRLEKSLEMQIRLRQELVNKNNECTKLQTTIQDTENALVTEKANVARAVTTYEQTILQARVTEQQASQNITNLQNQMQQQTQASAQQLQEQVQRCKQLESEVQSLKQNVTQLTNSLGQVQAENTRTRQLAQEQQQHLTMQLEEEKTARANEGVLARGKISVIGARVVELERQVEALSSEKQSLTTILTSVEESLEETERKLVTTRKDKKQIAEERDDFSVQVCYLLNIPPLSLISLHSLSRIH